LVPFLLNTVTMSEQAIAMRKGKGMGAKVRDLILVVDDDPDARELIAAALTQTGYAVELAADGFEALQKLGQARPDLVLTDLQMPGMHGVDLIQQIRGLHGDVPVILATGMETHDLCTGAEMYGAVACLVKPINLEELLWTIDCALTCHRDAQRAAAAVG
jgi:DNA-binding response OmpR family regulator